MPRHDEATRLSDTAFFGHPRGLGWLSFSELWERFSYYGMQSLLVLYMTQQLLLPGHVENVLGFAPFRRALESVYGPLSLQALGSVIFGLYAGLVYVTPILGGLLADRLLGRTLTVVTGASLMAAGHFLMAFDASFLVALLCLLAGAGCFKGNIATQVGDLYRPGDPRRARAFQIYMLGIQVAVIFAPLVCGTLGETVGWHYGFGAAGVGMVFGLLIYLGGLSWLPPEPRRDAVRAVEPAAAHAPRPARPALSRAEIWLVVVLVLLLPVLSMSEAYNQQGFNAYISWAKDNLQLQYFGWTMPVTWVLSIGAGVSTGTMLGTLVFWRWWGKRHAEPDEITKIALGATIAAGAPLLVAAVAASAAPGGHSVSLLWNLAFELINDIGFANLFPVALALYSRAAPKAIRGLMMGLFFIHLFAANMLVGWLGGLLDKMPAPAFWLLHAGIVAAAAALLWLVRAPVGRLLREEEGAAGVAQSRASSAVAA